ncbi:hypothetical protein ACHAWF_006243 [Thalassiosira exigua]
MMSAPKQPTIPDLGDTAADTFRETYITRRISNLVDEETGNAWNLNESDVSVPPANAWNFDDDDASAAPATESGRKGRAGRILAGALGLLLVVALSVGAAARNGGGGAPVAASVAPEAPAGTGAALADVPTHADENEVESSEDIVDRSEDDATAVRSKVPSLFDDIFSGSSADDADGSPGESKPFRPEQDVGDAALVAAPVELVAAMTTSSPTASPTATGSSAGPSAQPSTAQSVSPSAQPTLEPSNGPTAKPTDSPSVTPSASPSKKPTSEPTEQPTGEPSGSPSASPTTKPIDLSGWDAFNWSGETDAPTSSPTSNPTSRPTDQPTKEPTSQPTNEMTPAPTSEPTPAPTSEPIASPTAPPTTAGPFFFGEEFYTDSDLEIQISKGLSVRAIAWTGQPVPYANGENSELDYHEDSDAAGIISMDPTDPLNSGYVYVSNAESGDGEGGAYGIYFDKDGNVLEYKALLTGTTDNCGGGYTPWNTWVSCEEFEFGQCHEIDPLGRDSAEEHFPNAEGIQVHEGRLYFMSKVDRKLLVLDLEDMTYETEVTGKKMYGEGDFGDQPDQNFFGPTRKYMYFTEDGGESPGVHARYGSDGTYFTLFQGIEGGRHDGDETVGIALSPDHKRFYAGFQEHGILFEITRDDRGTFE